ncbi:MAG: hypothetical protein KAI17_03935, partial [Thiotrichaceae bacterium]|nr:hypothetical protein [Thiotrichaceae bacterium]
MKYGLILISILMSIQIVHAEFNDPMRPPAFALNKFRLQNLKDLPPVIKKPVKPVKLTVFELNSILYSADRQHAIINNQLVKKGDVIDGAKLVRLQPDSVRLLSKGKIIDLKIYDNKLNFKAIKKSLNEKK